MWLFQNSLNKKLLILIFGISSIVTFSLTAAQTWAKFNSEKKHIFSQFQSIERSSKLTLSESIWSLDNQLIQLQLEGIKNLDSIGYIAYFSKENELVLKVGNPELDSYTHKFPLIKLVLGRANDLGYVEIQSPKAVIYSRIFAGIFDLLILNMAKSFILPFLFLFIFNNILTKRIRFLSDQYRNIQLNGISDEKFKLYKFSPQIVRDELENLIFDFESMRINLAKMFHEKQEALDRAKEANRSKSEFLRIVGHEIRTPLNAIINLSQLSLSTQKMKLDPELESNINTIFKSSEHLLRLVNDILDISQVETNNLKIIPKPENLKSIIENVNFIASNRAQSKGLKYHSIMDTQLPISISVDKVRLSQILINLLNNAIKFSVNGTVSLSASLYSSETNLKSPGILFSVKDTGIGIPEDMRKIVFDRFFQIQDSRTRNQGGTGLGLAICKELVELMGGKIWIDPEYDSGTLVHFYIFPEIYSKEIALESQFLIPTTKIISKKGKFSILIAEDDLINQVVIQKMLQRLGYTDIKTACNGKEAILLAEQNSFDLVLMDIQMPEMDGIECALALRAQNLIQIKIPIIAATAAATPEDIQKCNESGMNGILMKPIAMTQLSEILEKYYVASNEGLVHLN